MFTDHLLCFCDGIFPINVYARSFISCFLLQISSLANFYLSNAHQPYASVGLLKFIKIGLNRPFRKISKVLRFTDLPRSFVALMYLSCPLLALPDPHKWLSATVHNLLSPITSCRHFSVHWNCTSNVSKHRQQKKYLQPCESKSHKFVFCRKEMRWVALIWPQKGNFYSQRKAIKTPIMGSA